MFHERDRPVRGRSLYLSEATPFEQKQGPRANIHEPIVPL